MSEKVETILVLVCVPVTLEYDSSRVRREHLVAEAERGLTNALHHLSGSYRIEGGEAKVHQCRWGDDPSGPTFTDEYLASLTEPPPACPTVGRPKEGT